MLAPRFHSLLIPGLGLLLAATLVAGLLAGPVEVDLATLGEPGPAQTVLLQLRLPRAKARSNSSPLLPKSPLRAGFFSLLRGA